MHSGWDLEDGGELKYEGRRWSAWAEQSRMREHESTCEILSPLSTLAMLGKASCTMLGVVTPSVTRITNDKGPQACLPVSAG
jgi:hypothetical protein